MHFIASLILFPNVYGNSGKPSKKMKLEYAAVIRESNIINNNVC